MNVIYCAESVADLALQWGAVGEYFSWESSCHHSVPAGLKEVVHQRLGNSGKCRYFKPPSTAYADPSLNAVCEEKP